MDHFTPKTTINQLTTHLREQILSEKLRDTMPGVGQLIRELEVGTDTVIAAMANLEREGLVVSQGAGRRRKIVKTLSERAGALQVEIVLYDRRYARDSLMTELRHQLQNAGHSVSFSSKSLLGLGMEIERVERFVNKSKADVWVVVGGSKPIIEWFAAQPKPAFAMFGRQSSVNMGSVSGMKSPALAESLRLLVDLGHRRIVMMVSEERRKPQIGNMERNYLKELETLGIPTGSYNLPDWDSQPGSFQRCLTSLFHNTPPTALILDEPTLFFAALQFLSRQRLSVPDDVSLIVLEDHPAFDWFEPKVTHLRTDPGKWVNTVMQWIEKVARGTNDRHETLFKAKLVKGGTIGPPRK